MFLNYLKYKSNYPVKEKSNEYARYLTSKRLKENGILKKEECNTLLTHEKERYRIYRMQYKNPNFVDERITMNNEEETILVIDELKSKFKILFFNEEKNNLDENIKFFEYLLEREMNENIKYLLLDRIAIMKQYNSIRYTTLFAYINIEDVQEFERVADDVFYIEQLENEQTDNFLHLIGNEVQA